MHKICKHPNKTQGKTGISNNNKDYTEIINLLQTRINKIT